MKRNYNLFQVNYKFTKQISDDLIILIIKIVL